ncbi:MFS transporter [Wenzhouxiangella marina]|uniref:Major facilitator superfamily MFS_1 n=1 Tax=Wenzhouxiangella marina TaxID=1579979 RepID=A0A0K0XWI6_9GAMM|nr:MFS transporter [Wenzhouxiangella marina]AKS42043.1 Major facilitator superfamily MFS_1 [Wenzhouxiangella marina]MBB6086189.1 MFS family permease [Wenzhouxiangella marina]
MSRQSLREQFLGSTPLERAYRLLVNQEDARVCKDIDEAACRVVPGNFFLQVLTQFFTKLGDAIANPKTILAWMLSALGAPSVFAAFLVPIRESGSMLPQLVIAAFVRQQAVRKWTYVLGCILQAAAVFAMAGIATSLTGTAAGFALLASLTVFSLSRGLCSVASKDVLGKTVPKTRRGRVSGWSEFLAGLVTIGVGVYLLSGGDHSARDLATYLLLLSIAGGLWLLASVSYALIREYPGATEGGANALSEAIKRLDLLRSDRPFRNFVIARALLLCSALSAPFFILLAHEQTGGAMLVLGLFVIADGLASLVSAPFWGRFADDSSRRVMIVAGSGAGLVGLALVALVYLSPTLAASAWVYPLFFFFLAIAHAGVRLGRKTYVVDLAGGNKRTDYVAVSNTVIGLVLLLAGGIGALAEVMPVSGVILILAAMGLAGAAMSARLPDIDDN